MATTRKKTIASVKPKTPPKTVSPKAASSSPAKTTLPQSGIAAKVVSDTTSAPMKQAHELKKRELVERIIAKNGLKRRDVKPIVETMLEVLGDAINGGETLNLQPLGKVMVKRSKDSSNAKISIVKIRQNKIAP